MATINADGAATASPPSPTARRDRFYARAAWVMLAMTLSPFPFTFVSPMLSGERHFPPALLIHAATVFAWIGLYVWQTQLVANGRVARHREIGLAGIAISALIVPLGVIAAIGAIQRRIAAANPAPFDTALYNVVDLLTFGALMTAAIVAVTRHREWHRRFIYGAALCLVGPAISRWFLPFPAIPPFTDFGPNILADLLLLPLALHDRGTLGRIHPATLWVVAALAPVHLLTPFATSSGWWRAIAPGLLQLAG